MHLFDTPTAFSIHIESLAYENDESCIDTVIEYCKNHLIEMEDIAPLVTPQLKAKIAVEMQEIGLMPKRASLF